MMIFACLMCASGCVILSFLKKRHRKDMNFPKRLVLSPMRLATLKYSGLICLAGTVGVFVDARGIALGLVYSLACFTLIAWCHAILLSARPQWIPWGFGGIVLLAMAQLLFSVTW